MFMARPAAEIEPQLSMFSSSKILPGPIRPSESRSIRTLSDGNDDLRMVCLFIFKRPTGEFRLAGIVASSIATAWIDLNVLSRRILIVAIALRQIVTRTCGRLRSRDRANGATGDSAHGSTNRPAGDQAAQNAADDRATDGASGRIGRRWRGWCIGGHGRRRIARARAIRHPIVRTGNIVHHLDV